MFGAKQLSVLRDARARWNILYGATRSGKTYVSYFLVPLRIREHWDAPIIMCGKTLATLERNVLNPMRGIYPGLIGKTRVDAVGSRVVRMFGRDVYCIGASDERAAEKIQGMGIGYAYLDELTTYPQSFFTMLESRLDRPGAKCDATCNPAAPSHYVKRHIDTPGLDVYSQQFTLYDNKFLPPEFVRNLEAEYRGTVYYDRFILGNWVQAEGLVYPLFDRSRHYLTPDAFAARYGRHRPVYVIWGVDGANANDATAIEPLAVLDDGNAVILEPFYHDPQADGALSNAQLLPLIRRYLEDMGKKYAFDVRGARHYMAVDCAAADLVLTLSYGLPAKYNVTKMTKKDIAQTTDVVNNAFALGHLYILDFGGWYNYRRNKFVPGDRQLVTDLSAMVWAKDGVTYDGSVPNDSADACRYAVATYYANPAAMWPDPVTD